MTTTTLKETLRNDLTLAMKSGDKVKAGTIRMALSAITNEEVAGKVARQLSDAEVVAVLTREQKKRREAAEAFQGRPGRAGGAGAGRGRDPGRVPATAADR